MSTIVQIQPSDFENCQWKDHFATHADAARRVKSIRKRGHGHRMQPYQCVCGGWILGHTHAEGAVLAEPKYERERKHKMDEPQSGMSDETYREMRNRIKESNLLSGHGQQQFLMALELAYTAGNSIPEPIAVIFGNPDLKRGEFEGLSHLIP